MVLLAHLGRRLRFLARPRGTVELGFAPGLTAASAGAPTPVARRAAKAAAGSAAHGLDKLKTLRSVVPAVTHVDYSARVQTVDQQRNPLLHRLMTRFHEMTGCPVLINTSFNVRGEPIVCRAEEAYRCFLATNIDVLVLERFVLVKEQQPKLSPEEVDGYLKQFSLD